MSRSVTLARRVLLPVLFLAGVALAGCAQQPVSVQAEQYYRLTIAPDSGAPIAGGLGGTLEVERFLADGLLSDRAIAYARDGEPDVLHQYRYHFWSDSPARMLQQATADYLRSARVASSVVTPELRVQADYSLICHVRRLEQVVGSPTRVLVDLEFALRRNRDGELVLQDSYQVTRTVEDASVGAAVGAMSVAVQEILAALLGDITRT